ncbi:MAG: prenyltransferase/squalene oxidase repeat-containing protein [Sphingomonadales bacterium]
MLQTARKLRDYLQLPPMARAAVRRDRKGAPSRDPGIDRIIDEGFAWLCRAQDCSATSDGGVARDFSLIKGWASSYPETTGYIVPTFIQYAKLRNNPNALLRARRMLNWLVSIQFPDGGFQGGPVDAPKRVPVTFNTGQILIGLAAGAREFGDYRDAMNSAAAWLVKTQDRDGCWRHHPTPFAKAGEKAYETHVAWGLFEAERLEPGRGYGEAGLKNVRWALTCQRENGWVARCCLDRPQMPLTHTLGYFLRGVVEAHRFSGRDEFLEAASLTANGLLSVQRDDGSLPGRLYADWSVARDWCCLTGNVQIAQSWLILYQRTGDIRFLHAGRAANRFVRRTIGLESPRDIRGGVAGSFPIDGGYGRFQYPSWAIKFAIDSNMLEQKIPFTA